MNFIDPHLEAAFTSACKAVCPKTEDVDPSFVHECLSKLSEKQRGELLLMFKSGEDREALNFVEREVGPFLKSTLEAIQNLLSDSSDSINSE